MRKNVYKWSEDKANIAFNTKCAAANAVLTNLLLISGYYGSDRPSIWSLVRSLEVLAQRRGGLARGLSKCDDAFTS